MADGVQALVDVLKARLSWKIAIWVFGSILIIETIIIFPSYVKREEELVKNLVEIAEAVMHSKIAALEAGVPVEEALSAFHAPFDKHHVLGGVVYADGVVSHVFGEAPKLTPWGANSDELTYVRAENGTRLDVVLRAGDFSVALRMETESVQEALLEYVARIAGLVAIVAGFVTAATIAALKVIVIGPILAMRRKVLAAIDSDFEYVDPIPGEHRGDELGDVIAAFNALLRKLSQAMSRFASKNEELSEAVVKAHEASLAKSKVLAELSRKNKDLAGAVEAVKTKEQALRESEGRVRAILNSIGSILIGADADGRVVLWNGVAEEVFGISSDDILYQPLSEARIGWDWKAVSEWIESARRGEASCHSDDICFTDPHDRERLLGFNLSPMKSSAVGGQGYLLLGKDITEQHQLEIELAQARKLESIGQLAAGIAHEINTPTQYVSDNTRFLKDSFGDLAKLLRSAAEIAVQAKNGGVSRESIESFERAVEEVDLDYLLEEIPQALEQSMGGLESVAKIVSAMKQFSHPGSEKKTPIDLNKALESTITVSRNEWKYVAELETDFEDSLPMTPCLPAEFNQVVLNLIVNAAHAIADVQRDEGAEKGRITVRTRRDGDWVEVRVRDTGSGIPKAIQDRIFDPFFTTKDVGKGTGQGLSIARSVIRDKLGGTLTFESEEGAGTTFIIRLPLEYSGAQAVQDEAPV